MRFLLFFTGLVFCVTGPAASGPGSVDPNTSQLNAIFSVDDNSMSLSTAAATIEPRLGEPGYSWLRISFYSFPMTGEDIAKIVKGDTSSMDRKWSMKADNPKDYNSSYALIRLSVDRKWKVWQVDMSVPGHSCTIAPSEKEVTTFLQDYKFDGKNLRLKSKGSYACDMKFLGIPDQRFGWDFDLNTQVFHKVK
jgi:hypothetical protein